MKKLLSFMLSTCLLATAIPSTMAQAAEESAYVDFTYEENFDSYADGVLPEGFTAMETASAEVDAGALKVNVHTAWNEAAFTGVLIDELAGVQRAGLTIEVDMTLVEYNGTAAENHPAAGVLIKENGGLRHYRLNAEEEASNTNAWFQIRDGVSIQGPTGTDPDGETINGQENKFAKKDKVTLKLTFDGSGDSAACYVDGACVRKGFTADKYNQGQGWINSPEAEFQIGLGGYGTVVKYDNIKITGKKSVSQPETVAEYGFIYEENFDEYENGALPAGFTAMENVEAVVEDGALKVNVHTAWDEYAFTGVLIDDLKNVQRAGLTIEMDMTLVDISESAVSGGIQPAAGVFLKNNRRLSHYRLQASADGANTWIQIRDGLSLQGSLEDGGKFANKNQVKLKLVFNGAGDSAFCYVDGEEIRKGFTVDNYTYDNGRRYSPEAEFQLGLGGFGTVVKYDNIKITGTKKVTSEITDTVLSATSNYADGVLGAVVEIEDIVSADSNVFLAVYEKETDNLVGVAVKEYDPTLYQMARLNLQITELLGYSAETHYAKVMVFEESTLRPLAVCVQF